MKRHIIPALALCGALLTGSLPVNAAYEPEEITLCLRALDLPDGQDPQIVHISPEAAKTGASLHLGIFIEADRAEISLMGISLHSDCRDITFPAEIVTPQTEVSETPVTYTLADGTSFETKFKPYCLGAVNRLGVYLPSCFSCTTNTDADDNTLTVMWMYGIGQAEQFLGGKSDAYSFLDFDVKVAENIPAGTYHIDFVTAEDAKTAIKDRLTYITSDNGTQEVSEYHDIVPRTESLTIIVDSTSDTTESSTDPTETTTEAAPTETTIEEITNPPMPTTDPVETTVTETTEEITDPPMPTTETTENITDPPMPTTETTEEITDPPMPTTEPAETTSLKGDANGNGEVNAEDASLILMYAAAKGAGETPRLGDDDKESQRFRNADVNADGALDATDASAVLVYAAASGAGTPVTWKEIIG